MVCNHSTTMALVVVVVASLSATSASDEDEALASFIRSNPRAAAMAEAAAAAAAAADPGAGTGSSGMWESAQPDPRWYLVNEAEALQELGLVRPKERLAASATSAHRSTAPSQSMDANAEEDRRRVPEHKRSVHKLSIIDPLDVLRQSVLLESARRRQKQSEGQIRANMDFLRTIGKRGRSDALASNALIPSLEAASDSHLMEVAAAIQSLSARRRIPSWWQ